ncbi:MAG: tetratricopeptide repeat protein [Gammaproteobacteria bacterium]
MKTTLVKNLSMILSLTALAACSGPPSVGDIEEQLVSVVVGDAGGIATLENFEKINGLEKDEKTYIADVKYDLVFSNDAQGMLQQAIKELPPATLAAMGSEGLALAAFGPAMMGLIAGQTFSIKDTVTFIETEKGWVLKKWHPEELGNAMGESLLEKMATALLSSREPSAGTVTRGDPKLAAISQGSEHTDAKVETQQVPDTLASREAEMKRVMDENARLKAENEEAKRRLEEQQAAAQEASATADASASMPQNASQLEGTPGITQGKVPNLRPAGDFHNAMADPFVAEMITAALANDNRRIIEIRDQLLSQPKPQRGDRKRARALNDKGLRYFSAQDFDKAVTVFQLAAKSDPGDIEIINNLGYALMKAGRLPESEQALIKTLRIAPDRTSAWANLGHVYAMTGKKREAVACFTNAYRFSQNAEKTKNVFTDLSQNHENQNVRQALAEALRAM